MSEGLKATPTEYKGVRFRSKSEAIFARCLDLAGWHWVYEPPQTYRNQCGHQWDFYVSKSHPLKSIYIEYKPSEPTEAYVENLHRKVRDYYIALSKEAMKFLSVASELQVCQKLIGGMDCPRYLLFYGSPFDRWKRPATYIPYPIWDPVSRYGMEFVQEADNGEDFLYSSQHEMTDFGITEEMAQEARSYRFDLKH